MSDLNLSWWEEKVEKVPSKNWLYKIVCFLLFKKRMTYKELYLFYLEINNGNQADEKVKPIKKRCLEEILNVYHFNNKQLPKEMEEYVR
jgi:hypothetical protein